MPSNQPCPQHLYPQCRSRRGSTLIQGCLLRAGVSAEHTCQFVKQVVHHHLFQFDCDCCTKDCETSVTALEIERIRRCADVQQTCDTLHSKTPRWLQMETPKCASPPFWMPCVISVRRMLLLLAFCVLISCFLHMLPDVPLADVDSKLVIRFYKTRLQVALVFEIVTTLLAPMISKCLGSACTSANSCL